MEDRLAYTPSTFTDHHSFNGITQTEGHRRSDLSPPPRISQQIQHFLFTLTGQPVTAIRDRKSPLHTASSLQGAHHVVTSDL